MKRSSYWKISGFYFFYFASLGAFMPYWGPYLREQGFAPDQIGVLMAVVLGTKIIAPNVWGWLADYTGKRTGIIRLGAMLAALLFLGVMLAPGYLWLAAALAFFGFFWNAVLPQFEATTLGTLGDESYLYSRIRLWGSVGFIFSVAGLGEVFERFDMEPLPWVVLALLAGLYLNTLLVRDVSEENGEEKPVSSVKNVLRHPAVQGLLLACFFMQASHGPYYTFFTVYLEDFGYSRSAAGLLWALGVAAEVGVFLVVHRWLLWFGAWRLLLAALLLTVLRWAVVATLAENPAFITASQTLHAASYGVFHAAAIQLIFHYFPGDLRGRGQALYSSLSFGLGGAAGSLASGYLWAALGGPPAFGLAAALAAAGFVAALAGMRFSGNSALLKAVPPE